MKILTIIIFLMMLPQEKNATLFDAHAQNTVKNWYIVNDGVMGGLSKGHITLNESENALFTGHVTTANNGGFTSIRYDMEQKDVSNYKVVKVLLKGDGKQYQFRIKSDINREYSYLQTFETSKEWETIELPFAKFYPSYRGNKLAIPNFEGKIIEEIAFLIGNKRDEDFALEIDRIYLE